MQSLITPELKEFIEGSQGISMGTRDKDLTPEYTRVLGASVNEDGIITFYTAKDTSVKAIENIDNNKLVSITLASPLSYECYQFKGKCITYRDSNEIDQGNIERYLKGFNDALNILGIRDGIIYKWPSQPSMAIEMKVEEIFEQTPKVGAGKSISK